MIMNVSTVNHVMPNSDHSAITGTTTISSSLQIGTLRDVSLETKFCFVGFGEDGLHHSGLPVT